jgi:subtilisin-like proprotein convertase family protein
MGLQHVVPTGAHRSAEAKGHWHIWILDKPFRLSGFPG